MDRFWLKSYPAEVPHEINPAQYRSLGQLLDESFSKNANRPFSVCMDRWMSYGELDERSTAIGVWLRYITTGPVGAKDDEKPVLDVKGGD